MRHLNRHSVVSLNPVSRVPCHVWIGVDMQQFHERNFLKDYTTSELHTGAREDL